MHSNALLPPEFHALQSASDVWHLSIPDPLICRPLHVVGTDRTGAVQRIGVHPSTSVQRVKNDYLSPLRLHLQPLRTVRVVVHRREPPGTREDGVPAVVHISQVPKYRRKPILLPMLDEVQRVYVRLVARRIEVVMMGVVLLGFAVPSRSRQQVEEGSE